MAHQPRRTDFQRTLDKETRARNELMRRREQAHRAKMTDNLIDALAARSSTRPPELRFEPTTTRRRRRLHRLIDGIHARLRDFWQAHR